MNVLVDFYMAVSYLYWKSSNNRGMLFSFVVDGAAMCLSSVRGKAFDRFSGIKYKLVPPNQQSSRH
jgi:hypothetical protein